MQTLIIFLVILLVKPFMSFGATIQIFPSPKQYFGGNIVKPSITCQPSQSCGNTIKWFFGQLQIDTTLSKYSTSKNLLTNYETLTVHNANIDDDGLYHCQCTFSGQAVNSPQTQLKHTNPVSFSTTNNLVYQGVVGGNITLICVILDFVEFQWQFSDKSVVPSNNGKYLYEGNNLTILNLSVNDAMSYLCVGNNQVTTVNKLKAQLLVYKHPTLIANGETVVTINEGDTVVFNCTGDGNPQPSVSWSKSGAILKFEGRISKEEVIIDQYTIQSTFTIQHVQIADEGLYLCTGHSSSLDKQASVTKSFTLNVMVPPEPLFQVFTIAKDQYSITISWILSGIISNLINVTWNSTVEAVQYETHFSNESSVVIASLLPNTMYMINAEVIGTEYSDTVNDTTNKLEIVSFLSSSIYSTLTSVSTTNSVSSVQHFTYVIPTTVRPSSTSNIVRTTTRGSTTSQTRPDPTVAANSRSIDSNLIISVPLAMLFVLVISVGVVVIGLVCLRNMKGRDSKKRNLQSIERANSSRSSQGLLEDTDKFLNAVSHSSFNSIQSAGFHHTGQPTGQNVSYLKKNPSELSFHRGTSNVSNQSSDNKPPMYSAGSKEGLFFIGTQEPFQMTDNPCNSEYEVAQSSQLVIPQMTNNAFFDEPGSSVNLSSQNGHVINPYPRHYNNTSSIQSFDYTNSTAYEATPFKENLKSQSEPPQFYTSTNALPVYENNTTKLQGSPRFGIVEKGKRGAIREQVEIMSRH